MKIMKRKIIKSKECVGKFTMYCIDVATLNIITFSALISASILQDYSGFLVPSCSLSSIFKSLFSLSNVLFSVFLFSYLPVSLPKHFHP